MSRQLNKDTTPALGRWLLRKLCRDDYYQEVAGDLQEVYDWRSSEKGAFKAKIRYFLDVFSAFRFYRGGRTGHIISKSMLYSFIISSFRNFKRHLGYTSLNVLGLAMGLTAALFILEYVSEELNYNNSTESERIYRVSNDYYRFGEMIYESCLTFSGVGQAMVRDLPEVTEAGRMFSPGTMW